MSKSILIFTALFFIAELAQSQGSDETADSLELDNIVITASKIPLTRRETTKPVLIIDRRQIERSGGKDITQLLNEQSGIRLNSSYNTPSSYKSLFLQGATGGYTLVLIDGIAISDPSDSGGAYDLRMLPLSNVERIEVIKGSQSTLYGTDAIAGVVNIITKKGSGKPVNVSGTASYGSYNSFNGSLGINGKPHENLGYAFNYTRTSTDGISAAAEPEDYDGTFRDDGFSQDSFFGKTEFKAGKYITVSPFINYSSYEGDYDADAFQDASNIFEMDLVNPGVQFLADYSGFRINGGYQYTRSSRSFTDDFGTSKFEGHFHNADLYGTYRISPNVELLGGFNMQSHELPGGGNSSVEEGSSTQFYSPYATIFLKNLSGWNAEVGYRLNNHSEYGNNSTFSFAPSYEIAEGIKLFASAGTGFKAPTLNELFGPFGANPDLEPQKSIHYTAGAEAYLLDRSLKLGGHYFNRKIDDVIIYASQGFLNQDQQHDSGMEFSADWIANSVLKISTYYNYVDGELTTYDAEGNKTTDGNLVRRPAHSVGASADIQITGRLLLNLQGEYNGERTDLFFNPENNYAIEEVVLDPYTLVNVYAEYSILNRQLALFADIRNLFDADFIEVYGYDTIGLAVKGGVRFNF